MALTADRWHQTIAYRSKFKRFVLKLSRQLTSKECEELFYAYKENARLPESLRPGTMPHDVNSIRLLERLEQACEFSYEEPQKLSDVFTVIERDDLCKEVETFITNNVEEIQLAHYKPQPHLYYPHSVISQTHGGNLYGQETELSLVDSGKDGPYYPKTKPAVPTVTEIEDGAYVRFQPHIARDIIDSSSQRSYSLDSFQARKLPRRPDQYQPGKKLLEKPRNVGRWKGFQHNSKPVVNSDDESYSYVDPRTLRLDLPMLSQRQLNHSPTSTRSSSSCCSSLRDLQLGTFTSLERPDSSELGDGSVGSDSSDDPIYDYPDILQILPSEPRPLVDEKMRLLVRPIRKMIQKNKHEVINTEEIAASHHSFSNVSFQLRISTGPKVTTPQVHDITTSNLGSNRIDLTNQFISAELYLLSDTEFPASLLLQAHLQVCLPRSFSNKKDDIKPHSWKKPTSIEKKQQKCFSEQKILLDLPGDCHKNKDKKKTEFVPLRVASFPNIMSHSNFVNESLIITPHLNIKLLVREFVLG